MSSSILKLLDNIELEVCCTKLSETFSVDGSFDVEVHDPICELKLF
jgi:hypothetical protein